jgi:hypothetical protein
VLLLLALSLPVLGAPPPGPTKLLEPDVAPRTADAATPVTFSITYRNAHALPPDYVRVAVAGGTYAMSGAGTDWKAGVVFTVTITLPQGTHDVWFEARDAERFVDELPAGLVAIGAAPPPPPLPPPPPPDPTAAPVPPPQPADPPGTAPAPPTSGGSSGSSGSSGGSTSVGSSSPSGNGGEGSDGGSAGTAAASPDGTGSLGDGPDGTMTAGSWTSPDGTGDSGGAGGTTGPGGAGDPVGAGTSDGGTGTGQGSWPASAAVDAGRVLPWFVAGASPRYADGGPAESGVTGGGSAASGTGTGPRGPLSWIQASINGGLGSIGLAEDGLLPTIPAVVGSTVMVTTWLAFMLFNKRRRDGEPPAPDGVLQAAAATGIGIGVVLAPAPVAPPDPEALMPRWRRPSLLEARKTDPVRTPAPERPRLSFSIGGSDVPAGGERRTIRYAVIPLLDRPDEILASRIGELVAGDEVQVEQRSGAYCHVLCPDGRQGWIHRTTLGDVVAEPGHGNGRAIEPEPEAENALAAMLAARGLR